MPRHWVCRAPGVAETPLKSGPRGPLRKLFCFFTLGSVSLPFDWPTWSSLCMVRKAAGTALLVLFSYSLQARACFISATRNRIRRPRSPTWHRRQRAARAKARGRCRAGRGRLHDAWLLHITEVSLQRCTQGALKPSGSLLFPSLEVPTATMYRPSPSELASCTERSR